MLPELKGQTALITGAARGLGLLVAERLAAAGVHVCGVDRRHAELQACMEELNRVHAVNTLALKADIGVEDEVIVLVKSIIDAWGRIDILVNNAGVREVAPVQQMSTDSWDTIHNSNLKGQFLCSREVLRQDMRMRDTGTIIFVSSDAGTQGSPGSSAYAASKWAGRGFAASLAKDLKKSGIRISTVIPGRMWTPMAEESEAAQLDIDWLDPARVADAVMFCILQQPDTVIPELEIYHRSQL